MAKAILTPDVTDTPRGRRSCAAPLAVLTGALAMAALGSGIAPSERAAPRPALERATAPETQTTPTEAAAEPAIESTTAQARAEPEAGEAWQSTTGGQLSRWAWTQIDPPAMNPSPDSVPEPGPEAPAAEPPRAAMIVPLPVPRPPELRGGALPGTSRRAERRMSRVDPLPAAPQPQADDRSFLEKLFGVERGPALAYAALENKPADLVPQRRISPPLARAPSPTGGTAVYNISARIVTLPNGERLEAHSGLGEGFDEPRLVHVRMRGPTPPGTYDLTEREQPFHGVRAIRLTPVGGSEAIYGRVGLLAHTFMLGPRGDSNGCVSFRNYDRFLQAFLQGEIQRLVVVTGTQDPLPSFAEGSAGTRVTRNGG
jgi:hypothetical protein